MRVNNLKRRSGSSSQLPVRVYRAELEQKKGRDEYRFK